MEGTTAPEIHEPDRMADDRVPLLYTILLQYQQEIQTQNGRCFRGSIPCRDATDMGRKSGTRLLSGSVVVAIRPHGGQGPEIVA